MSKRLDGKFALVTGGNSGIGLATARLFVREGAKVAICGRDLESLAYAQQLLGRESLVLHTDISHLAELDALFGVLSDRFGHLDILFANAGVAIPYPFARMSESNFDAMFDVNVKGTYFTVQKALPYLRPNATIVLNASIAQYTGVPGFSVYAATKAAVRALGRNLAGELADRGIRVNVVSPGPIATPIWGRVEGASGREAEIQESMISRVPLGRMGRAEEVAETILFLASDASSYITGCEILVDGGVVSLPAAAPALRE